MPTSWLISTEAQLFISVVSAGSMSACARQWQFHTDEVRRRLLLWQAPLPSPLFCIYQDLLLLTIEGKQLYCILNDLPLESSRA
jgi:hypothetical protein